MNISKNQAIQMLDEMYRIAAHASLTGALRGGVYPLIRTFNKIRDYAIEKGWIDGDLILEVTKENMPSDSEWMDDIGVSATLFAEMLKSQEIIEVEDEKEYDENGYEIMPE